MHFKSFSSSTEEIIAENIITGIDRGEYWIFKGAENSKDFGGFIHRLYFGSDDGCGVFCACIFCDKLRFIIGFDRDIPEYLEEEITTLIKKTRERYNTKTSVWYTPDSKRLDTLLRHKLPWKGRGHKTHELTFTDKHLVKTLTLPENYELLPFEESYILSMCEMLDVSLAHTYSDPNKKEYMTHRDRHCKQWLQKAQNGECMMLVDDGELVGAYILKDAEIDIMAVKATRQRQGLGRYLLYQAATDILDHSNNLPHLYCLDSNKSALRFYLREGMTVTGHSGCLFFKEIDRSKNQI